MVTKRCEEHAYPVAVRRWYAMTPMMLMQLLAMCLLLFVVPGARAAQDGMVLSGPMDTPARFAAMQAKIEIAIARGDRQIDLESPGGSALFGWLLGEQLHQAGIKVRCIGWCASSGTQILLVSRGCIVARSGRVALHAPQMQLAGLSVTDFARQHKMLVDDWRGRMREVGVPNDLLDRTLWSSNQVYELSSYDMKRVGCTVE